MDVELGKEVGREVSEQQLGFAASEFNLCWSGKCMHNTHPNHRIYIYIYMSCVEFGRLGCTSFIFTTGGHRVVMWHVAQVTWPKSGFIDFAGRYVYIYIHEHAFVHYIYIILIHKTQSLYIYICDMTPWDTHTHTHRSNMSIGWI